MVLILWSSSLVLSGGRSTFIIDESPSSAAIVTENDRGKCLGKEEDEDEDDDEVKIEVGETFTNASVKPSVSCAVQAMMKSAAAWRRR